MGMGDVKMLAMIGAFLGWPAVLLTLILSSFAGALIGIILMTSNGQTCATRCPLAPFSRLPRLLAMLAGDPIVVLVSRAGYDRQRATPFSD